MMCYSVVMGYTVRYSTNQDNLDLQDTKRYCKFAVSSSCDSETYKRTTQKCLTDSRR